MEVDRKHADAERDRLERQIEIAMLQAQINPHFLYNTLECIRGQALAAGETDIADTTQALSRLFRYSISMRNDAVPLRDELDNVRNYMKIQQYRFRDRFTLEIRYDEGEPELLDGILPKLTLQPIVENAVVHGFKQKAGNARIAIEIVGTRRHLNILVSDNGQGMNAEMLERLRALLRGDPAKEREPARSRQRHRDGQRPQAAGAVFRAPVRDDRQQRRGRRDRCGDPHPLQGVAS